MDDFTRHIRSVIELTMAILILVLIATLFYAQSRENEENKLEVTAIVNSYDSSSKAITYEYVVEDTKYICQSTSKDSHIRGATLTLEVDRRNPAKLYMPDCLGVIYPWIFGLAGIATIFDLWSVILAIRSRKKDQSNDIF